MIFLEKDLSHKRYNYFMTKESIHYCRNCPFITLYKVADKAPVEVTCEKAFFQNDIVYETEDTLAKFNAKIDIEENDNYTKLRESFRNNTQKNLEIIETFIIPNECPYFLEHTLFKQAA